MLSIVNKLHRLSADYLRLLKQLFLDEVFAVSLTFHSDDISAERPRRSVKVGFGTKMGGFSLSESHFQVHDQDHHVLLDQILIVSSAASRRERFDRRSILSNLSYLSTKRPQVTIVE